MFFRIVAQIQPVEQQWYPLRKNLSEQVSLWLTPLTAVLRKESDVARCLFWAKPTKEQELYLLQLWSIDSFLSINPFPLSNLFQLSGSLTFPNYTQSVFVTALISVCLPSVLLFKSRRVLLFIHYVSPVYYNKFSQVEIRSRWNLFQALLFHFVLQFSTC